MANIKSCRRSLDSAMNVESERHQQKNTEERILSTVSLESDNSDINSPKSQSSGNLGSVVANFASFGNTPPNQTSSLQFHETKDYPPDDSNSKGGMIGPERTSSSSDVISIYSTGSEGVAKEINPEIRRPFTRLSDSPKSKTGLDDEGSNDSGDLDIAGKLGPEEVTYENCQHPEEVTFSISDDNSGDRGRSCDSFENGRERSDRICTISEGAGYDNSPTDCGRPLEAHDRSRDSTSPETRDPWRLAQNGMGYIPDSHRRTGSDGSSSATANSGRYSKLSSEKKKRNSYWYSVLSPTYKSRSEDFKKIFKDVPNDERLIVDYSCAMQKDILVQGRIYISQNWICFYANIFRWETVLTIRCKDITAMTKERTARVIPNAVQISTKDERYFFTSFSARDKTFLMMFRVWQNALIDQSMNAQELWQWVHYSYGEELGLTSSDDDYIPPTQEDAIKFQESLQHEESFISPSDNTQSDYKEPPDEVGLLNGDLNSLTVPNAVPDNISMETASTEEDSVGSPDKLTSTPSPPPQPVLHVPSPDATSADFPTDIGDTTEDDEVEVTCSCHDHVGLSVIDEVFTMPVDKLFECVFTDCKFYRDLDAARKTFDVVLSPWPDNPDEDGNKVRTISYTLPLNHPIGPKCSFHTEKQILYKDSRANHMYLLDCESHSGGIPYGDAFYLMNRYCITRVSHRKSRLQIHSEIRYNKSVWGFVKNFIERNVTHGVIENYNLLALHLRNESDRLSQGVAGQPLGKKKVLKRRRLISHPDRSPVNKRTADTQLPGLQATPVKTKAPVTKEDWRLSADILVRVIVIILIVLVLVNALLFYKLWSLEQAMGVGPFGRRQALHNIQNYPKSRDEWLSLLQQQQHLHDTELDRWKDVLTSSVQLIEQMKRTLVELHESLQSRADLMPDLARAAESGDK